MLKMPYNWQFSDDSTGQFMPYKLLFVCLGNICRSPAAENIMNYLIEQVKAIKKLLGDPKRKLTFKQLAEKYGVSEMTLYRIKSGENWGKIK